MDSQKPIESKYYKWVEPTLFIRKSQDNLTSYILYHQISNFKINNDSFKLVTIEIPIRASEYISYIKDYRKDYSKYLENLRPDICKKDSGFSSMINAIEYLNDNLIMIYKNYAIVGALSYDVNDKRKDIIVSHIGVIERRKGYGTILMKELFKFAKIMDYSITATSNGYADKFYQSLNMRRVVDKPLGIYNIKPKYIGDL
jgi:hypothetical protein